MLTFAVIVVLLALIGFAGCGRITTVEAAMSFAWRCIRPALTFFAILVGLALLASTDDLVGKSSAWVVLAWGAAILGSVGLEAWLRVPKVSGPLDNEPNHVGLRITAFPPSAPARDSEIGPRLTLTPKGVVELPISVASKRRVEPSFKPIGRPL